MFFLYQVILSILLLVSPVLIFYRILINKESKDRFYEKYTVIGWLAGKKTNMLQMMSEIIYKHDLVKYLNT